MNRPLRRRLLALMLVALMPVVVLSCIATLMLARQQRLDLQQATMLRARATVAAVDAKLDASVDWLQMLASVQSLRRGDLAAFHDTGRRAVGDQPRWLKLVLLDPAGNPLLDTSGPFGEHSRQTADPASVRRVVESQQPVIGNLSTGVRGARAFPVRVPVIADGSLKYILTAVVSPEFILQTVVEQEVAGDHAVAVLDTAGTVVARSRGNEQFEGQPATEAFRHAVGRGMQGWSEQRSLDGEPVFVGFSRSATTGWTAAVALPQSAVAQAAQGAYLLLAGGVVLSLLAAAGGVLLLARRTDSEAPATGQDAGSAAPFREESP